MKVVHIQVYISSSGNAIYRLHKAMRENGIDSKVLVITPSIPDENVSSVPNTKLCGLRKVVDHAICYLRQIGLKKDTYMYSSLPLIGPDFCNQPAVKEADVIYLQWLAGRCMSMAELKRLAELGKPIIVFMHDMWTFTGGCHYSFECRQYESGCKECPLFKYNGHSAESQLKQKVQAYSKHKNIAFVSPSKWMAECAKQSPVTKGHIVTSISNLIDESVYKPMDKIEVRRELNLPMDKKLIAFGCQGGGHNPIKGWKYLAEAVNKLQMDNIAIVMFGCNESRDIQSQVCCPIYFMGNVSKEETLAKIYNAADVYVSPSLAESFGMTLLESQLCGTPVVGFDNTAISELVKTNVTGYLAENKNSDDLARGIKGIFEGKIQFKGMPYSSKEIIRQHLMLIELLKIGWRNT